MAPGPADFPVYVAVWSQGEKQRRGGDYSWTLFIVTVRVEQAGTGEPPASRDLRMFTRRSLAVAAWQLLEMWWVRPQVSVSDLSLQVSAPGEPSLRMRLGPVKKILGPAGEISGLPEDIAEEYPHFQASFADEAGWAKIWWAADPAKQLNQAEVDSGIALRFLQRATTGSPR